MQIINDLFSKLLKAGGSKSECASQSTQEVGATIDASPGPEIDATALGVKFNCKYSWQIQPPAGWQRQESGLTGAWPFSGTSPSVSFSNTALERGESAMIRWQLAGNPDSAESHQLLEKLLSGQAPLSRDSVRGLSAPGIVSGMTVTEVDRFQLPGGLPALVISARYQQLKGEQPLLRYVIILPDRVISVKGENTYFRETIQFVATESSFWTNEKLAIVAMKTFRRSDSTKTAEEKGFVSGVYPVVTGVAAR